MRLIRRTRSLHPVDVSAAGWRWWRVFHVGRVSLVRRVFGCVFWHVLRVECSKVKREGSESGRTLWFFSPLFPFFRVSLTTVERSEGVPCRELGDSFKGRPHFLSRAFIFKSHRFRQQQTRKSLLHCSPSL